MCGREKSYSCRENNEGGDQNYFVWFTYMNWRLFMLQHLVIWGLNLPGASCVSPVL